MSFWVAGAAVVGTVGGGLIAADGAKDASRASVKGQQAGVDETRRQYDITRADFSPYRQTGNAALNQLAALYGIPAYQPEAPPTYTRTPVYTAPNGSSPFSFSTHGGELVPQYTEPPRTDGPAAAPGVPDYSGFYNSPDYQFARDQGEQAVLRNRSATGNLASGNTLTELTRFGQGLASQQYGNYTNRLAQLAGIGQSATGQLGQFGSSASGNIASLYAGQGDARASGIAGQTNAWGGALNQLGTIAGDYFGSRRPKVSGPVKVGLGG